MDQDTFNSHTDYIEKDDDGNVVGMWANYYGSEFEPINPGDDDPIPKPYNHCILKASGVSIRNGGSFRTLTNIYLNENEEDVSFEYSDRDRDLFFVIDEVDVSEYVSYVIQDDKNIIKIKFNNSDYIGKILTVRTLIDYMWGEVQLEII